MDNKSFLRTLGRRISYIRQVIKKLSQEEAAFRSDISCRYLSDVEGGRRNISAINLMKLAKGLNVEVGNFFPPVNNKKSDV